MSIKLEALNYLHAWENGWPIEGGIAWEAQLRKCKLDYSWASLSRIDKFLLALKTQVKPSAELVLQRQDTKNLLRLLGFYLVQLRERVIGVPVTWLSYEVANKRQADWEINGPDFVRSLIVDQGGLFAPLAAIWNALFDTQATSLAEAATRHLEVPVDVQKAWPQLAPQNLLPNFYQHYQEASISPAYRRWIESPLPKALPASDDLQKILPVMPHLLQDSRMVWACIVQANQALFEVNPMMQAPAEVLYDHQGRLDGADLLELAQRLHEMKNQPQQDPALEFYASHLRTESTRVFGWQTPASFNPYPLTAASTMFSSEVSFPGYCLALPYFPVLVSDSCPGMVVIAPWQLWPESFFNDWCERLRQQFPGQAIIPTQKKATAFCAPLSTATTTDTIKPAPKQVIYSDVDQDAADNEDGPVSLMFMGLVCLAIAVFSYNFFAGLEQNGGSVRINAIIYGIYKLLGKSGVAGLFGLAGLVLLHKAWKKFRP